eukprot:18076-Chlamydomonas_euryale.AAC.2
MAAALVLPRDDAAPAPQLLLRPEPLPLLPGARGCSSVLSLASAARSRTLYRPAQVEGRAD